MQQSGDDHEFCSVVGCGKGNGTAAPILHQGHKVHPSRTQITDETQNIENVAAIGFVDAAVHCQAEQEQSSDREQQ